MKPSYRRRRAFGLIEVIVTFVLVGVVSAVAVMATRFVTSEVKDRVGATTLESAAGAEEAYYLSRGNWAMTAGALAVFSNGEIDVILGASTDSNTVSVAALNLVGVDNALGMAVLSREGICLTQILTPPETSITYAAKQVVLSGGATCTGALAG